MGPVVDAETGFQYLRARYYDPATGQFMTRDPLEPVTGTPYAYANNSPLNFTDPSGEIPLLAAVALAWGAFEVGSAVVDSFSTAKTLTDSCASGLEKLASAGLFVFGAIAPGGGYSTAARSLDDLSAAGRAIDRNGFTAAGRAAQKHGNRPNSGIPLSANRTARGYNDYGQDLLDDLLTAPNTATRSYVHPSYGTVTEYIGPQYGARFGPNGDFMGFL